MQHNHPLYELCRRIRHHVRRRGIAGEILDDIGRVEDWIEQHAGGALPRRISVGVPLTVNLRGEVMPYELPSNKFALFPLKVNGAAPPAGDTFSVVSNNPDQFTAEMAVMPPEAAADAGSPAVKVTCLTHAGATGVSFTVSDDKGDTAATETFDIVAPAAPSAPPGVISVDDAGIATSDNPNPPAA